MEMFALTGISKRVIDELMEYGRRTLELRSSHNIASASQTEIGQPLFITSRSKQDLSPGTDGIIARVVSKEVNLRKIGYYSKEEVEEHEIAVGRIQLEVVGTGRAFSTVDKGITRESQVIFKMNMLQCD